MLSKTFAILALVLGLTILVPIGCKNKKDAIDSGSTIEVYSQTQQRRTPDSPLVASLNGVSDQQLQWIDEGLQSLSEDIAANPNLNTHNIAPYLSIIYVLHTCQPSPESGTPSFLVRADNYDGTQWDQDPRPGIGKVYAAEYVITDPDPWRGYALANEWIICSVNDAVYTRNAARYGNEHKFLWDWYPQRYEATATHTNGGHPIITANDGSLGLAPAIIDVKTIYGSATGRLLK